MPDYGRNGTTFNLSSIQMKFKLASEWTANDVLLAGEIGVEKDTHKAKIGDGLTAWSALPYSADPNVQGLVDALTTRLSTAESSITSLSSRMDTAEGNITSQGTRITSAESTLSDHATRITTAEGDIDTAESNITSLGTRATAIEAKNTEQDGRLTALEGITSLSANPFRE